MSIAQLTDVHQLNGEVEPSRRPLFSVTQWVLLGIAGLTTVVAAGWWIAELNYRGSFDAPDSWQTLVYVALTAWAVFLTRGLLERIERNQQTIIDHLTAVHSYHHDLGERLDHYGDAREIRGHHIAAGIQGNGSRRFSVVDGDA